jgi:23S rRNA (adenine2503-C2)-methyltransferase
MPERGISPAFDSECSTGDIPATAEPAARGKGSPLENDLKSMDTQETEEWAVSRGLDAFRGRQIRQWLFKKWVGSFEEMTNISKELRAGLARTDRFTRLERVRTQISKDATEKVLFRLEDGEHIESVLIPEKDHFTLCISSQVGCAMGCRFCVTARQGLKRNLSPGEILDQVIQVKRGMKEPERLTNIVFMGMGEPLANYDAVLRALFNIIAEDGLNFSHRKVTLSTCGLVPGIRKLGRDITVNLAVSLNAADDETRSFLMPVNGKYGLEELLAECRRFPLPNRRMITFEYILIRGIDDRDQDALNLAALLSGIRAKINLIPFNAHPLLELEPTTQERVLAFQDILADHHYTAIVRKSKGRDISAACGQLSGETT